MSATFTKEPISVAVWKHDLEIATLDTVRATDFLATARSYPLDQTAAPSDAFCGREVHSIAPRKYLIAWRGPID